MSARKAGLQREMEGLLKRYEEGRRKENFRPLPELVIPGEWDVKPPRTGAADEAYCDMTNMLFGVPFGKDTKSTAIRYHEYLHLKYSPKEILVKTDLEKLIINSLEDARINHLGLRMGVPLKGMITKEEFLRAVEIKKEPLFIFLMSVCALRMESQYTAECTIAKMETQLPGVYSLYKFVRNTIHKRPNFKALLPLRDNIMEFFGLKNFNLDGDPTMADLLSGEMRIVEVPTPIKVKVTRRQKRLEMGMFPNSIERIFTDGRIFREKVKGPRVGTILIDCSGSMSLNGGLLQKIMKSCEGVKIATYSGHADYGELRVLAKDGRIATMMEIGISAENHPCNVIDYPSLKWLIKQNPPFIWVTDGFVTGKNDCAYPEITLGCRMIVRTYNIIKVDMLEQITEAIKAAS